MKNQHQHLLQEFEVEVNNLVPVVPDEIKKQAKQELKRLKEKEDPGHEDIHPIMLKIGKKEYPYRKAYNELKEKIDVKNTSELALEKMDDQLQEKIRTAYQEYKNQSEQPQDDKSEWMDLEKGEEKGFSLHNLVKEISFEQKFNSEENRKIEISLIEAEKEREKRISKKIKQQQEKYEKLVQKWKEIQQQIENNIEKLQELKQKTEKWQEEIEDEIDNFQESWSIVEQDPQLKEIEKRIDYWQEKINEEKDEKQV